MYKRISIFILALLIISSPLIVVEAVEFSGLVPKCNVVVDGVMTESCDFNYLMTLINKVINFLLITLATPLFALIIVYTGWLYLSAGGSSENVTKAKHIFKNALIGYVIALAAWLIVKTILTALGFKGDSFLGLILINNIFI